ncbi:phosphopantetheine-binding protein [Dactylosporangium sp. NPDC050688]|uniref:phosphopantetheine-binding protein n=1 Tax=Dactylosporangium sp. NPDC050688 TaxID=3157217 RepID=UPI0033CAEA78
MADHEELQIVILEEITAYLTEEGRERTVLDLDDRVIESGLDSLGLAVVVTRLEDRLGYDPFGDYAGDAYPQTVRELVTFYQERRPVAGRQDH